MQTTISKLFKRSALCTVIPLLCDSISLFQHWVDFQSWSWWFFNHISSSPSFQNVSGLMQSIWIFQRLFIKLGTHISSPALVLCWSGCRLGYELLWGLPRLHPERPWQCLVFRRVLILAFSHSTCSSTIYLGHQSDPLKLFADDIQPSLDKRLL